MPVPMPPLRAMMPSGAPISTNMKHAKAVLNFLWISTMYCAARLSSPSMRPQARSVARSEAVSCTRILRSPCINCMESAIGTPLASGGRIESPTTRSRKRTSVGKRRVLACTDAVSYLARASVTTSHIISTGISRSLL